MFAAFYAVAYSVVLGIRDNYLRYYQKAELQWTGPSRESRAGIGFSWLLVVSFATAWVVVELAA